MGYYKADINLNLGYRIVVRVLIDMYTCAEQYR